MASEIPLRVFLVEDSPSVRDRLIDFLAEPGKVDVIGFADTETEAVRQLWAEPVDVAIGLNLGENRDGVELRALQSVPRPTVVVLTNYAFPEFEVACRERGADYFFDKSTQFGALKVLLQSIQRKRN
jgi:DNA-binding NarL/FixJ family response regulator